MPPNKFEVELVKVMNLAFDSGTARTILINALAEILIVQKCVAMVRERCQFIQEMNLN